MTTEDLQRQLDSANAEIERLKQGGFKHEADCLEKVNSQLKSSLQKAQACCAEKDHLIELVLDFASIMPEPRMLLKQALATDCGSELMTRMVLLDTALLSIKQALINDGVQVVFNNQLSEIVYNEAFKCLVNALSPTAENPLLEELEEYRKCLGDSQATYVNLLRGTIKLTREAALCYAGAQDHDQNFAELQRYRERFGNL